MFNRFIVSEDGAVTVDWVVITCGIVALILSALIVFAGGSEDLTGEMAEELAGLDPTSPFRPTASSLDTDFAGGRGPWAGGDLVDLLGFGSVLRLGPGGGASMTADVATGASLAVITFDIIGGDDLAGEPALIYINNQRVAMYSDDHGSVITATSLVPGVTVNVNQHYTNDPMGAGTHGHDSRATMTITVQDPSDNLTIGIQSTSTQPTGTGFYAIDDVSISVR